MDRKKGNISLILKTAAMAVSILTGSCQKDSMRQETEIFIGTAGYYTKAAMPDEEKITDVNLFVFNCKGKLEYHTFSKDVHFMLNLLKGEEYRIHACVNFGHRLSVGTIEDMETLEYHLAYPDEYRDGMPMHAATECTITGSRMTITLEPVRLMSRISIRMDRSRLSKGTSMSVASVKIGNCPKKATVCSPNRIEDKDGCFSLGFMHSDSECEALNTENNRRISRELSLYMLENMQGSFSDGTIVKDHEKVFEDFDIRSRTCSYIELELDYSSDTWQSGHKPLIYRFYLGESLNDLDIERNCHYHITVCPEDDGLKGEGWRIDKTGLDYIGHSSMQQFPDDYIIGNIGDEIHIGCRLDPPWTPFDVGEEYLEADRKEGIYDYTVDADGHGVTLKLTGAGRGLIYMEAGAPVNDAALFLIEVNTP